MVGIGKKIAAKNRSTLDVLADFEMQEVYLPVVIVGESNKGIMPLTYLQSGLDTDTHALGTEKVVYSLSKKGGAKQQLGKLMGDKESPKSFWSDNFGLLYDNRVYQGGLQNLLEQSYEAGNFVEFTEVEISAISRTNDDGTTREPMKATGTKKFVYVKAMMSREGNTVKAAMLGETVTDGTVSETVPEPEKEEFA